MVKLIIPCEKYLKSYIDAYNEYTVNGISSYAFTDSESCDIFEKFENYRKERNLKPNRVGADYYWLVDDERNYFIGEVSIRHRLTDALLRYGGHIGYGVRFSEWNKGYGTLMLKLALEKAEKMGIKRVLITCDDDNIASAKVIENNGMIFEDKIVNAVGNREIITRRYWKYPEQV